MTLGFLAFGADACDDAQGAVRHTVHSTCGENVRLAAGETTGIAQRNAEYSVFDLTTYNSDQGKTERSEATRHDD